MPICIGMCVYMEKERERERVCVCVCLCVCVCVCVLLAHVGVPIFTYASAYSHFVFIVLLKYLLISPGIHADTYVSIHCSYSCLYAITYL